MRYLQIIDRATGETEEIREDDPNYLPSIVGCAERLGMSRLHALESLERGEELATAGFIRRIREAAPATP